MSPKGFDPLVILHQVHTGQKSDALPARVLAKAQEPLYVDFGPTLLSEHLARDPTIGVVHRQTLRRMNTSIHPWLEARSAEPIVLIAMVDDATSALHARFFPRDTGAAHRTPLLEYLTRWGPMGAL